MRHKECRRELEQLVRTKDWQVGEADDDYVARMAKCRARQDELRQQMKTLQEAR